MKKFKANKTSEPRKEAELRQEEHSSILTPSFITRAALAASLVATIATTSQAADAPTLGRQLDVGARAAGLAGSYTAAADDFSALYYNPAGLTSVRRHELHFSLEQNTLDVRTMVGSPTDGMASAENLRIQSLGYVMPIPTVRGGLSFGFGYYRQRDFHDALAFTDALGQYLYRESGTLNNYRVGMGLELSEHVVLGLATGLVTGEKRIREVDQGETRWLEEYSGLNLEPSLLFRISPNLRLGASLVALERLSLLQTAQDEGSSPVERSYSISHPFQFKLGAAWRGPAFMVSADYRLGNWSQYEIRQSGVHFPMDEVGFRDEKILSLGSEIYLPPLSGVLRAGYAYTVPSDDVGSSYRYRPHRASAGLGFLVSGNLSLDVAYSTAFWQVSHPDWYKESLNHQALFTVAYRY